MRLTASSWKQSAASKVWIARQAQDAYVRRRTGVQDGESYRSRSAFKLLALAQQYPLVGPGKTVVDLGAAPGGWSQVAANANKGRGRVLGIDILGLDEIPGADILQGDFLHPSVQDKVLRLLLGSEAPLRGDIRLVDTVLSDMMAPMSGIKLKDVQANLDLVESATEFARKVLRTAGTDGMAGGSLVMKFFAHPELDAFKKETLQPLFKRIVVDKPKASRSESSEAYWVCLDFKGSPDD